MADPSDEADSSAEALEGERGIANRLGGESPRASMVGPFASRHFLERLRRLEAEAQRELTVQRFRSLVQIARPPAPVAQMAVVGRAFGELAEAARYVLPLMSPAADAVLSFLEDLYTAVTGRRVDYSEFDVEASDIERVVAIIGSVLAIVPEAGPLLRQGGRVGRIAGRMLRSTAEVEAALRLLNRFSGRRHSIQRALADLRRGERLTAERARELGDYVAGLRGLETRRAPAVGTAASGAAVRDVDGVPDRGVTGRSRNRTAIPQREPGTGSRTRSRSGRPRGRRQPGDAGRRAEARASGRARGVISSRLTPRADEWLARVLRHDAAELRGAARELDGARAEVIDAINTFHVSDGFHQVVTAWLAGGSNRLGGEFVMRFALDEFGHHASPVLRFEMPTMRGGARPVRRLDIFGPDGARVELKWGRLRSHLRSRVMQELANDLVYQLDTPLRYRWVFSEESVGASRAVIVMELQKRVSRTRRLAGYQRLPELLRAIDEMVEVWPGLR